VSKKTATYLQLLKETGARPSEISKLSWTDIDFERRTARIKHEKGSLPRILPLSVKAIELLNNLSRK
jgi:integrase